MQPSFQSVCYLCDFAKIASKIVHQTKFFHHSTILGECIPPRTISVAASAFNLILTIANLDLNAFQVSKLNKFFLAKKIGYTFLLALHFKKKEKKWQEINGDTRLMGINSKH